MNTLCYVFTFAFEQFISYIYFSNKFELKRKTFYIFLFYMASFAVQFCVHLLPVPEFNLLSFFICNIIVTALCYKINAKQLIFNVVLIEGLMITTELLTMFLISALLKINLSEYTVNDNVIFLEMIVAKILYFIVAYLFSKISIKETDTKKIKDFSLVLFILPLASIVTIVCFVYLSFTLNPDNRTYFLFSVISLILLVSNVVIFYIHQKVVATLTQNAEYQIIQQRAEINQEHYIELERQYDVSSILVHDIKRHLHIIREYAEKGMADDVVKYIDSVYDNMKVKSLRQFSEDKLVNVILNRYSELCVNDGISLYSDVRSIDFSVIDDSDLVALLDNLLENSIEAARNSEGKFIDIRISDFNESFIVINVKNSTANPPQKIKGKFYTTKSAGHGSGIKSIERVAKKYDGHTDFEYDSESNTFSAKVVLNPQNN